MLKSAGKLLMSKWTFSATTQIPSYWQGDKYICTRGTGPSALWCRATQNNTSPSQCIPPKAVEPKRMTPTDSPSTSWKIQSTEQHAECHGEATRQTQKAALSVGTCLWLFKSSFVGGKKKDYSRLNNTYEISKSQIQYNGLGFGQTCWKGFSFGIYTLIKF